MAHGRKYTEETTNRTLTFYKRDLDTLQKHATYKESVTDLIQTAIKDLIRNRGWEDEPSEPGGQAAGKAAHAERPRKDNPTHPDSPPKEEPREPDDPTASLPDYLRKKG